MPKLTELQRLQFLRAVLADTGTDRPLPAYERLVPAPDYNDYLLPPQVTKC